MRTISQRELRNDNAAIMRELENGESFVVTRRGVPVGRLVSLPESIDDSGEMGWASRARVRHDFTRWTRVSLDQPASQILDDLRGER